MYKFQVGDKVRRTGYNHRQVVRGEVYTVVEYRVQKGLILEGLADYGYSDYNFELVEENMNKQFTKDKLVAGKHIVELRNGHKFLILKDGNDSMYGASVGTSSYLEDLAGFSFGLCYRGNGNLDVVKVYTISRKTNIKEISDNLELIWQREEKSQSQIELEKLQKQISELQTQAKRLEKSL